MSGATPTIVPRVPHFPSLIIRPPRPHLRPLSKRLGPYATLNQVRDLDREMKDLSGEENELEVINANVRHRGNEWMIPIGKTMTRLEEKNDADEDEEGSSDTAPSSDALIPGTAPIPQADNEAQSAGEEEEEVENDENQEIEVEEDEDEDEEGQDLDASMDDMDETGDDSQDDDEAEDSGVAEEMESDDTESSDDDILMY